MRYSKYNVVIIGSGLAGLYLANKLADNNNFSEGILIITKDKLFSGSTSLAQGGIVSVIPELNQGDSVELHIKDTLKAGCGINDISAIKMVSENSSLIAQELMSFGVEFDRNDNNTLNFTLEGAHSHPRILHANGDSTGSVIEEALCKRIKTKKNVDIYENTMALELLVDNKNTCKGLISYNWEYNSFETIYSQNIVIATGGIGQIYKTTTNPDVSTGDGIALAYRAGCELENMEFVQFHPTALYCKNKNTVPLVSESVRGEGAKLVDIEGNYFAKNYHHQADLAPRDVVARAIIEQMKITKSQFVNLDISQIGIEKFKQRFPTITKLCAENGIDLSSGLIPVAPCEHYFMGGIKTDLNCATSVNNLYAIGECASSGLHGANRLASNSLLECAVFAYQLSDVLSKNAPLPPKKHDGKIKAIIDKYSDNEIQSTDIESYKTIFDKLKSTMQDYTGILRNDIGLKMALDILFDIKNNLKPSQSREFYELQNALLVSQLIIQSAILRKHSLGAHYRDDEIVENINIESNTDDKILAQ